MSETRAQVCARLGGSRCTGRGSAGSRCWRAGGIGFSIGWGGGREDEVDEAVDVVVVEGEGLDDGLGGEEAEGAVVEGC